METQTTDFNLTQADERSLLTPFCFVLNTNSFLIIFRILNFINTHDRDERDIDFLVI